MIDLSSENVIRLREVPRHVPRGPDGKRIHIATAFRWAQRGCNGIRLETLQIGGAKHTSVEKLQEFCEKLTAAVAGQRSPSPSTTSRQRAAAIESAGRELDAAGI